MNLQTPYFVIIILLTHKILTSYTPTTKKEVLINQFNSIYHVGGTVNFLPLVNAL